MHDSSWAASEFKNLNLGDKRLNQRLINVCEKFSEMPESPINQTCDSWAETKAAYRFFKNKKIREGKILESHAQKTLERMKAHKTILVAQDTSYISYSNHKKTRDLGKIGAHKSMNNKEITSWGLIMHSSLAMTTAGTPLGLLDQKISVRNPRTASFTKKKDSTPIEEKESFKWLESLKKSQGIVSDTQIVTICDREADMYEFFEQSYNLNSPVLVRAKTNRVINKSSRWARNSGERLRSFISKLPVSGNYKVKVPSKNDEPARTAKMSLKYGKFNLNAPLNNINHRKEKLKDLEMSFIHVFEVNPPKRTQGIEWILLTNLPVKSTESALEKVYWYTLRWRIEMFHKVLKSGFKVENCRLSTADRLKKYLTVMSIVACRMFMITLIARESPNTSCQKFLSNDEWKVLFAKTTGRTRLPKKPPNLRTVLKWVAKLGGFLGRKNDGNPGMITLWRGWKRLTDLVSGWKLANQQLTYG